MTRYHKNHIVVFLQIWFSKSALSEIDRPACLRGEVKTYGLISDGGWGIGFKTELWLVLFMAKYIHYR